MVELLIAYNTIKAIRSIVLVDLNEFPPIFQKEHILTPDIRKQPQTSLESI